uniref:Uncharacterized protein n=1 Tax=Romanomermis culicivorax TaxID=13658 RepID=A0A915HXI4_ROMCU
MEYLLALNSIFVPNFRMRRPPTAPKMQQKSDKNLNTIRWTLLKIPTAIDLIIDPLRALLTTKLEMIQDQKR